MPEDTWTTRDGRKLKVTEMTDEHVQHTIAMLERKLVELRTTIEIENLVATRILVTEHWIKLLRKEQRRRWDSLPSTEAAAAKAKFLEKLREGKRRPERRPDNAQVKQEVVKPASRFANLDLDDPEDES